MSSTSVVRQLREHLDELSSSIVAQEAVLHNLRTQRSEARRKLNRFLDPMARLPFEIQSHIFLSVDLDSEPPRPDSNAPPMIFTNVCRLWRDIALATPKLWDALLLDLPRGPQYAEFCKLWLSRACSHSLSLKLSGSLKLQGDIQELVTTYRNQIENLSFTALSPYSLEVPCMVFYLDPRFPLSSLKTLSFEADEDADFSTMSRWLGVLRAAPALASLTMRNMSFLVGYGELPPRTLTLPSLEVLHVGQPYRFAVYRKDGSTAVVLQYLTLPALKTLNVSDVDISKQEFVSFLSRSSPTLESFHLTVPHDWSVNAMSQLLRPVPSLSFLELSSDSGLTAFLPSIEVLSTSDVLPNLRQLTFNTNGHVSIAHYGKVLSMLTFRCTSCPTRLDSFVLNLPSEESGDYAHDLPAAEVRAALRRLVDDGLNIHIGPRSENLL
ncbi:F-box domain-containing protein [Favolaschia claudopus]|uniref:F-box domain-containing protein n=1 Tax=Favolaschia claudopus TaxID=2862362 RepID=A0AAW0D9V1_9AGAR